jgi:wyosine [tRNA(Phe)-imidazoG37] synthetase (radical SAM superfamily)
MTYIFGPVPSRRLGRSLGVDLVPPKTCVFDCIYCEVGPTTHQSLERRDCHTDAIIEEVAAYLSGAHPPLDVITLAGSGEPTLNLGIGRIIGAIKAMTPTPVAVLTNGALLHLRQVRQELAAADIVLPSLDAAFEATFQAINRPLPGYTLAQLLAGLRDFRKEYAGRLWLEALLLKGINDSEAELQELGRIIKGLAPDKIQLNTAVRPVVEAQARPLDQAEMEAAAALLAQASGLPVEVVGAFRRGPALAAQVNDADFLAALARRPMTAHDLVQVLGLPLGQVEARLKRLAQQGLITCSRHQHQSFYRHVPTAA